jgi:hypothetical protein
VKTGLLHALLAFLIGVLLHLAPTEDGMIETVRPPDPKEEAMDLNEALVESVEVALEEEERKHE